MATPKTIRCLCGITMERIVGDNGFFTYRLTAESEDIPCPEPARGRPPFPCINLERAVDLAGVRWSDEGFIY
jgi:hypothetical protein